MKCKLCGKEQKFTIGLTIRGPMVCTECDGKYREKVEELIIAGYKALNPPRPDVPSCTCPCHHEAQLCEQCCDGGPATEAA